MRPLPESVERAVLVAGSISVLVGLAVILWARSTFTRMVYVSEMGAVGEATAAPFSVALLLVAAGGLLVGLGSRDVTARVRWLARWTPSLTLVVAGACFAFASQVTCTKGCPLPVGSAFTWQDLLHTSAAVIGFAAACFAMLQVAFARSRPVVARLSLVSAVLVGVIAGVGGLLSVFRLAGNVGGWLEFVAMVIAILWLAAYGLGLAFSRHLVLDADERAGAEHPLPSSVRG